MRFYQRSDIPNPFKPNLTANDIWEYDKKRLNILKKQNYKILIVWEYDYLYDKEETIKKCKKFLYEENN